MTYKLHSVEVGAIFQRTGALLAFERGKEEPLDAVTMKEKMEVKKVQRGEEGPMVGDFSNELVESFVGVLIVKKLVKCLQDLILDVQWLIAIDGLFIGRRDIYFSVKGVKRHYNGAFIKEEIG
jgi:hypothetical protein